MSLEKDCMMKTYKTVMIKSLGKPSIHLGGGNQLLFGIRGKRWDTSFAKYDWYGTKDWVRPIPEEIPQYNNLVEGGCYW